MELHVRLCAAPKRRERGIGLHDGKLVLPRPCRLEGRHKAHAGQLEVTPIHRGPNHGVVVVSFGFCTSTKKKLSEADLSMTAG
jgi:hypothetical protein